MAGTTWAARLLGSLCVSATVALAVAGVAAASEDDYIYDLNNHGIGGPRPTLISLGTQACSEHGSGVGAAQSMANIRAASQLNAGDAQFLYDSALMFLC